MKNLNQKNTYNYRNLLLKKWDERRTRNSSYSLRAFAKDLQVGKTTISDVLNGKRKLSSKNAQKIIDRLNLSPVEANWFLESLENKNNLKEEATEDKIKVRFIEEDSFRVVSDWYHFAILALARLKNVPFDPLKISERLNISSAEARIATERLVRLGYIENAAGTLRLSREELISRGSTVACAAVRKHHLQNLQRAKESLANDPKEIRDFSSITFAANPKKLEEARKMIQRFRHRLMRVMGDEDVQEVYTLAIQLFPQTRESLLTGYYDA